jgi:hypothetical protein
MDDEIKTLLDALREIRKRGYFDSEVWDWFDIEVEINDWEDHETVLHNDIPEAIEDIARSANVSVHNIYHLKDEIRLPEYILLLEWDGEGYTLELDVLREDGAYTIFIVGGMKGWAVIPPYYHPIYPFN